VKEKLMKSSRFYGTAVLFGATILLSIDAPLAQQVPPGCNWKKYLYAQDAVQQGKIDTSLLNQMSTLVAAQGYSLTNKVLQTCNGWLMEAKRPDGSPAVVFVDPKTQTLHWGLGLVAVIIPVQLFIGHLNGKYVVQYQPSKIAAIEARWHDEKPASEVLLAWPDVANRRNLFAITLPPPFGSLIDSDSLSAGEVGPESIPRENWPPVVIPFFAFRIMVGMGLIMLAVSWFGVWLRFRSRLKTTRWFLWVAFLSFPTGFVAVLAGWFTAEVGRQPWVLYGLLRTKDAVTPSLTTGDVAFSLIAYIVVYVTIYSFGFYYIYRLLRDGPAVEIAAALPGAARAGALRGGGE
jgi:cytochrome bd-type quinol oxidase subunit 1